jgi:sodium-dependent dicarboxylate transporter 2/3/5
VADWLGITSPQRIVAFGLCGAVSLAVALLVPESADLNPAARRALFILLLAATLWVTEAVPAFAVGILVIGLQIALLGKPGGVFAESPRDWEQFVVVIGHPLVWLFFGGFVLAAGMATAGSRPACWDGSGTPPRRCCSGSWGSRSCCRCSCRTRRPPR